MCPQRTKVSRRMIHHKQDHEFHQRNTFVRSHSDNWETHQNGFHFFGYFFEERSPHLIPPLALLLFFVYWSSFLDPLTDISNFNYLVLKMSSEETFILSSVLQQIAVIQEQLLPASGVLRVSRHTTNLDLKVTDHRSQSSCHQGFTCFPFVQLTFHLYSFSLLEIVAIHCSSNFYWQKIAFILIETFNFESYIHYNFFPFYSSPGFIFMELLPSWVKLFLYVCSFKCI